MLSYQLLLIYVCRVRTVELGKVTKNVVQGSNLPTGGGTLSASSNSGGIASMASSANTSTKSSTAPSNKRQSLGPK